jgi:hypothetical protein
MAVPGVKHNRGEKLKLRTSGRRLDHPPSIIVWLLVRVLFPGAVGIVFNFPRPCRLRPGKGECPSAEQAIVAKSAAPVSRLAASGQNESAPEGGALSNCTRLEPQAATLVGLTSRSLLEFAIGINRGFMASGISRTRSTCRSPFSRLAPLTFR